MHFKYISMSIHIHIILFEIDYWRATHATIRYRDDVFKKI